MLVILSDILFTLIRRDSFERFHPICDHSTIFGILKTYLYIFLYLDVYLYLHDLKKKKRFISF